MKLKPCPFCGGEANIQEDNLFGTFVPYCPNCLTQKGRFASRESAIEAWNRREPIDRIIEKLEAEMARDKKFWERDSDESCRGGYTAFEDAIEIVKSGGAE